MFGLERERERERERGIEWRLTCGGTNRWGARDGSVHTGPAASSRFLAAKIGPAGSNENPKRGQREREVRQSRGRDGDAACQIAAMAMSGSKVREFLIYQTGCGTH